MFTAINMSRTVSARIPKELHEELRERCNKIGCSINDFLEASIGFFLDGHSDFDFGDEEDQEFEVTANEKNKEIPVAKATRISDDDGKTWIDLTKKEEKPKVAISLDD